MGKAVRDVPPKQGGGLTLYVFVAAFVAAQAGLIFGYDLVSLHIVLQVIRTRRPDPSHSPY